MREGLRLGGVAVYHPVVVEGRIVGCCPVWLTWNL